MSMRNGACALGMFVPISFPEPARSTETKPGKDGLCGTKKITNRDMKGTF